MPDIFDKSGVQRDLAWLRQKYGNVQFHSAGNGKKFRLARIDETEGPAVLQVRVLDEHGTPHTNQPVANHWPDNNLPDLRNQGHQSLWRERAIHQRTGNDGFTGFGLGNGSYIRNLAEGGAHTVWVLSPSLPSDGLSGIGMLGGTNHMGPLFLTFQIGKDEAASSAPADASTVSPSTPMVVSEGQVLHAKLDAIQADLRKLLQHFGIES